MRPVRGSRTSTNSVTDGSKPARSKGRSNDAFNKSNPGPNGSNASKKPAKEKNKEVVDIQPLVYSFRVPSNPSPGSVMNALLPPYWLYHDHAFGVIWMLFHQDKKYIGIAQLHWCLRFLLDLKNTEGEYTGDVNVCIQAVQDDLIEQYANVGTALEKQNSLKEKTKDPGAKNEGSTEDKTRAVSDENESSKPSKEIEEGNETSAPLKPQSSKISGISKCSSFDESGYISAQSFTYNEMMSRGPTPYKEQIQIEQIYRSGAKTAEIPASMPDIAAMLTSDTSPPNIPLAEMGNEELVSFLRGSREEHVARIKKEIERIHDLEKFMEGIDKEGFKAWVGDDFARRLDNLDGQGVVRGVDTMLK